MTEFLFQVLDPDEFEEEGPFFVFFKRDDQTGDILVIIKNPLEGWLWSSDPEYGSEIKNRGQEVPPSSYFIRFFSVLMDDPSWRLAVSSFSDTNTNPSIPIDDDALQGFPPHEEYVIRLVEAMVEEKYPFPPELEEYLLEMI